MTFAGRSGRLGYGGLDAEDRWHRMEDLLTADVFGAYRYLPTRQGILPLLAGARSVEGTSLEAVLAAERVPLNELTYCEILIWPVLAGKEPDVLVMLGDGAKSLRVAVLVEAKLFSGQHQIHGLSQLGFYARAHAAGSYESLDVAIPEIRHVLYLTRHADMPRQELTVAEAELSTAPLRDSTTRVFWTNWTTALERAAADWMLHEHAVHAEPWWRLLGDLVDDLQARGFMSGRKRYSFPLPPLLPLSLQEITLARILQTKPDFRPMPADIHLKDVAAPIHRWRIS